LFFLQKVLAPNKNILKTWNFFPLAFASALACTLLRWDYYYIILQIFCFIARACCFKL